MNATSQEATERLSTRQALFASVGGASIISFVFGFARIGGFARDAPDWIVVLAVIAYALALIGWSRLWGRSAVAAGIAGASILGLFVGAVAAVALANLLSPGPDV